MKLKYEFVVNQVADQMVAVPVGDGLENFNGFVKMNDIGAEIFEMLKEDVTLEEIVEIMLKKHPEATKEEALETVTEFTEQLKKEGIVDWVINI